MSSGVYEVFNKTAMVKAAFAESARQGVVKACFDTEAIAKSEITRQNAIDTGAARASIYTNAPGRDTYDASIAAAKSEASKGSRKGRRSGKAKGKVIRVFPRFEISKDAQSPEGVVAVGVLYGFYIEFGSTRVKVSIPPRPFMTPAAEQVAPRFEQYCLQALQARLR